MATKKNAELAAEEVKEETVKKTPKTKKAAEETAAEPKKATKAKAEAPIEEVEELIPDETPAPKAIDPEAEVARKSSRFAHEIAKASKKDKKEMYRSEHVVTEFGDEEVETEATLLRRDYLELVASAKSGKILEGVVTGYRYAGEYQKSTVLAEIEYSTGLFMILIPSYLMYDYEVSNYIEPGKIKVIENNIQRRIGSRIKFIVRHVDEKEQIAYADRLFAQSIIGYENYIRPTRDGKPRITEGMIVKGQVIYTTSKGIIVEALGTDILVRKEELMWSYVGDAREEFSVGDSVNIKIKKVEEITVEKNGTNYRLVVASGSVKEATVNHKAKLFDQFKVDGIYSAEITYVEEAGVFCRLRGKVDALIALPRYGINPQRGQQRLVKITEKDEDRLFLYGVFVNN